jgi:hypothetical protein
MPYGLVEVGAVWVSEFSAKAPILGIKIGRTSYVAFKNARKLFDFDPDYYIYEHLKKLHTPQIQAFVSRAEFEKTYGKFPSEKTDFIYADLATLPLKQPKLKAVGVVWRLFNRSDVQLSIKIGDEYYYALQRNPKDPSQKGGFVVVSHRTEPDEYATSSNLPQVRKATQLASYNEKPKNKLRDNIERLKKLTLPQKPKAPSTDEVL